MAIITGFEDWILGIIVALVGFAIPQAMTLDHPRKWRGAASIISGFFVVVGIILILVTK